MWRHTANVLFIQTIFGADRSLVLVFRSLIVANTFVLEIKSKNKKHIFEISKILVKCARAFDYYSPTRSTFVIGSIKQKKKTRLFLRRILNTDALCGSSQRDLYNEMYFSFRFSHRPSYWIFRARTDNYFSYNYTRNRNIYV